jgi:hypothetical protein
MVWADILLSMALPFVAFAAFSLVLLWLAQRTPISGRAVTRAREMAPLPPRASLVDHRGNVRHEWAVDLEMQRLRQGERRW